MKGLLLFIKNNRIIYKASIVSILILMLISVMQINPNNENKTISGTPLEANYTICFDASSGDFSIKGKSKPDVDKIISSLGIIDLEKIGLVSSAGYFLSFNNVKFSTTAPIALEIKNGDVCISLAGENKISSSYSAEGDGFYGITTTGKITFYGDSSSILEVNAYNWDENGNKDCAAIAANGTDADGNAIEGKVNIQGATVKANGHGCNGKGIYARSSIAIYGANVTASGGNSSHASGLSAEEISITGGIVVTKGGAKAIGVSAVDKLILDKGGDMSTELIEGSTVYADTYTHSDIIDYPSINSLASYKYIKIGEVPTYYYKYTNNKLYKVSKDSTVTELNSTTWPTGCSVTEDGKLELNGFNFVTTANKVIYIVGKANVLVSGTNTIRSVCNTVDDSYGIYSDSIINITSTEGKLNVKGGKSAIAVDSTTGRCNVNGRVDASTTVDGALSPIKDSEFNSHYAEYKHVEIVPKVISVDITWGDMDFKYSESDLNEKWSNNTPDGDKIIVANKGSNVPVTASIEYIPNSKYTEITGNILQSKDPAAEYKNNTTVIVGSSIDAYLSLDGILSSSTTSKTTIGKVTVTISE